MPFLSDHWTLQERHQDTRSVVDRHIQSIASILAFMHWIGDEDRGLADVMVSDDRIVLIDNGLCGPGYSTRLRGTHPHDGVYGESDVLKKCYPGKKGFIEWIFRDAAITEDRLRNPIAIEAIQGLSDGAIREIVGHVQMSPYVAKALIKRRDSIAHDYADWLEHAANYFFSSENLTDFPPKLNPKG